MKLEKVINESNKVPLTEIFKTFLNEETTYLYNFNDTLIESNSNFNELNNLS